MNGKATTITDPAARAEPKTFSFDFSYWSHDNFHDEDGVLVADSDKYDSQRDVFNDLGQGVLDNAFNGFNCSLFAYGQTGAGKSFSMIGYGKNKGIVPITCDELYKKIDSDNGGETKYEVWFSMLEIYNEQVRDLLTRDNPKGGLPVKQNPKEGKFYVQGLKKVPVGSYAEIERRQEEGTANRTVASTQMNATSSRAHTVITISFNQITKVAGQERKKESIINLVDLAGSERAGSTGATGDRLKEGANINKSLSALGNVITALADQSSGKKKNVMVPYRDSVLTKLLANALGGNSKTIMIAALSPADINYEETLSTLRYADRAKKIKNKATVNENPMDKLIRELREENEKLKKMLSGGPMEIEGAAGMTEEEKAEARKQMEQEVRDQLMANMESNAFTDFDAARAQALAEDQQLQSTSQVSRAITEPHLVNLNEDPMLSGVIKVKLDAGQNTIGRKDANPAPKVILTGLSIMKEHAIINVADDEITIKPASKGAKIKVNGSPLTGERVLLHKDRLMMGSNNYYVFQNPKKTGETSDKTPDGEITWDFVAKELAEASGFAYDTSGMSADQARLQEQILELLPQISEVNSVSEELNKYRVFEPILMTACGPENEGEGAQLMIRCKNLQNDNIWLWERSKFINRRFKINEMYQQYIDNDDSWKKISENEDPFLDPPEPVLLGYSTVFLQSLAFALDFEDPNLPINDHKGQESGQISVALVPCNKSGTPLGEDDFVEDATELIGKPFYFKIKIDKGTIHNSRYNVGSYCRFKFGLKGDIKETKVLKDTLTPAWKFDQIITVQSMTQEHVDLFESGAITIYVYFLGVWNCLRY